MLNLFEHMKHKDGTYVAFEMSDESKKLLDNFVHMNIGLEERVEPDTYHITIIYSRTPVPDAERLKRNLNVVGYARGYEVFPTKTGDKCLVMRIECPTAEGLNKDLTKLGATSDYDAYKPHVTICYDYRGEDNTNLPIPEFPLYFNTVTVKPLDVEYIPANKKD